MVRRERLYSARKTRVNAVIEFSFAAFHNGTVFARLDRGRDRQCHSRHSTRAAFLPIRRELGDRAKIMGRKEAILGGVRALGLLGAFAAVATGCKHDAAPSAAGTIGALPISAEAVTADTSLEISRTAKLAAIGMQANVYAEPSSSSKKLGYLRLGTIVPRSERAHGTDGCSEGWYAVAPRGFVCAGKTASLEIDAPIVRAAHVRPDTSKPLPYSYAFVRAHAPLYLRPPTDAEAHRTEFKLDEHLDWWARRGKSINRSLDGYLFGAETEAEPLPFWLEPGERKIPNVSSVWVPPRAVFANRLHRHTGVAVVGSFEAGEWGNHRRFALTVDMRLLPVDKLKPEVGSSFHGVELEDGVTPSRCLREAVQPDREGHAEALPIHVSRHSRRAVEDERDPADARLPRAHRRGTQDRVTLPRRATSRRKQARG